MTYLCRCDMTDYLLVLVWYDWLLTCVNVIYDWLLTCVGVIWMITYLCWCDIHLLVLVWYDWLLTCVGVIWLIAYLCWCDMTDCLLVSMWYDWLLTCVGVIWLMSSDARCFNNVVLPALSSPRSRILNSRSGVDFSFLSSASSPCVEKYAWDNVSIYIYTIEAFCSRYALSIRIAARHRRFLAEVSLVYFLFVAEKPTWQTREARSMFAFWKWGIYH